MPFRLPLRTCGWNPTAGPTRMPQLRVQMRSFSSGQLPGLAQLVEGHDDDGGAELLDEARLADEPASPTCDRSGAEGRAACVCVCVRERLFCAQAWTGRTSACILARRPLLYPYCSTAGLTGTHKSLPLYMQRTPHLERDRVDDALAPARSEARDDDFKLGRVDHEGDLWGRGGGGGRRGHDGTEVRCVCRQRGAWGGAPYGVGSTCGVGRGAHPRHVRLRRRDAQEAAHGRWPPKAVPRPC